MYSPGNFTFLEPKITFREPKDNGSFLGNVSWKPLSSMYSNKSMATINPKYYLILFLLHFFGTFLIYIKNFLL